MIYIYICLYMFIYIYINQTKLKIHFFRGSYSKIGHELRGTQHGGRPAPATGFDAAGRLPGAYISSCFCLFICIYYVYYSYVYTLYIYTIIYVIIYIYIYINNQVCIGFHKKTSRCLQFILETNWPWNGLGP